VLGYCRDRFFGAGNRGPMDPFDLGRQTSVVGEGCCMLVLARYADVPERSMAAIKDVSMGSAGPVEVDDGIHLLGADGFSWYGQEYRPVIESSMPAASYVPYYGSFPSATAFDLAVAATAFRQRRLPTPPNTGMNGAMRKRFAMHPALMEGETITCITCNAYGYHGRIRVAAVQDASQGIGHGTISLSSDTPV